MSTPRRDGLAVPAGLRPHPEGGAYLETWRAATLVETPRGPRPTATAIAYLLEPGERSRWHRVRGAGELWVHAGGGVLTLRLGGTGDRPMRERTVLLTPGSQQLIAPDEWQAAAPAAAAVLVACLVSPGFEFADLEIADLNIADLELAPES